MAQWVKDLALSQQQGLGHCCGPGSVSGPGTSMCYGCEKKKNQKKRITVVVRGGEGEGRIIV